MKSIIGIQSLKIVCVIGNNPEERITEQEIILDLKMKRDFEKCAESDSIQDTTDYDAVVAACESLAKSKKYRLLESLAFALVHMLREHFGASWVFVRISKKSAIASAQCAFVEFEDGH